MASEARPRRSVLYMPGSNARALEKGRGLPADALILDLEDAVAPDAKVKAREQVLAALSEGGYGERELLVRINGLDTPLGHEDVIAAARSGAHGVLIPKVDSAAQVRQVERIMCESGAPGAQRIWCMMETPLGMLEAASIASSTPRLAGFVMGTSDLAKDLHCQHTPARLPMVTSLGLCMLAARAHGLAIVDGVYLDLSDAEGFRAAAQQGLEFGFDGKTLIHPKTIAAANEVFAPSSEAVAGARKLIDAHAKAEAEGKGVLVVDGKLVENLHVVEARRLVAMSERILAFEGDA